MLYYIHFTYTITGLGNILITDINPAPQDNCLQRTYSITSCTTLNNNKNYNESFFVKLVVLYWFFSNFKPFIIKHSLLL